MEWSVVRALKAGATWDEVREAAFMAALPAGIPAFEKACLTFNLLEKNKGMVPQDVSVVKAAKKPKSSGNAAPKTTADTAVKVAAKTAEKAAVKKAPASRKPAPKKPGSAA
jgi:hypothetical protein